MPNSPYLTVKEAAGVLGITEDGVRKLIRRGNLRAIKRSERTILIPRPAFDAYRRKLNDESVAPHTTMAELNDTLEARATAFERDTGMTPEAWVAAWKARDDDDAHTMQIAATAVGLVAEQQALEAGATGRRRRARTAVQS